MATTWILVKTSFGNKEQFLIKQLITQISKNLHFIKPMICHKMIKINILKMITQFINDNSLIKLGCPLELVDNKAYTT
jgi:hypothetical protein